MVVDAKGGACSVQGFGVGFLEIVRPPLSTLRRGVVWLRRGLLYKPLAQYLTPDLLFSSSPWPSLTGYWIYRWRPTAKDGKEGAARPPQASKFPKHTPHVRPQRGKPTQGFGLLVPQGPDIQTLCKSNKNSKLQGLKA